MRYYDNYKVDGVPILIPDADIGMTRQDLDSADSGRDESGVMHRIVVRSRVRSWEFSYSRMTAAEYAYMRRLLDEKPQFAFTFSENGTTGTVTAYCSGDSIVYRNARTGDYGNYKIKIIQC